MTKHPQNAALKIIGIVLLALTVAGCTQPPKEAKCSCFDREGKPTGTCKFETVSNGQPLTISTKGFAPIPKPQGGCETK